MQTSKHQAAMPLDDIHIGELYGKRQADGSAPQQYHVLAVSRQTITLQNVDNPLSQFETTLEKLKQSGYEKLSETPYVNLTLVSHKKAKKVKLTRCPFTLDVFAQRADHERPAVVSG